MYVFLEEIYIKIENILIFYAFNFFFLSPNIMSARKQNKKSKQQQYNGRNSLSPATNKSRRESTSSTNIESVSPFPILIASPHEKLVKGTCVVNILVMRRYKLCAGQIVELHKIDDDADADDDEKNASSNTLIAICNIVVSTKIPASGLIII